MRLIKFVFVGFASLFIVVTLISLLLPSEVKVSRAVVINAPENKIYDDVADLRNWKNWHPSFQADSIVIRYSTPSFGKGAYCNIVYHYQQTHLQITDADSSSIKFLTQLNGANNIENEINIIPVKELNSFQVEWSATTKLRWYPWDKFYGIFIDKLTAQGYQDALDDLKDSLERIKQ
jgi:polyketide cyclase/dehydrase/lipid transport protein